jgi:DoxX-like protein
MFALRPDQLKLVVLTFGLALRSGVKTIAGAANRRPVLYVSGAPMIRETLTHLGYPGYLLVILGAAKLLGSAALLQTRVPTLREWAYAGFMIDLIGAVASHAFTGDPLGVTAVPGRRKRCLTTSP